jgi:hypothetical protein
MTHRGAQWRDAPRGGALSYLLLFRISLTSSTDSVRPSIRPPFGAFPGVYFCSFRDASGPAYVSFAFSKSLGALGPPEGKVCTGLSRMSDFSELKGFPMSDGLNGIAEVLEKDFVSNLLRGIKNSVEEKDSVENVFEEKLSGSNNLVMKVREGVLPEGVLWLREKS